MVCGKQEGSRKHQWPHLALCLDHNLLSLLRLTDWFKDYSSSLELSVQQEEIVLRHHPKGFMVSESRVIDG